MPLPPLSSSVAAAVATAAATCFFASGRSVAKSARLLRFDNTTGKIGGEHLLNSVLTAYWYIFVTGLQVSRRSEGRDAICSSPGITTRKIGGRHSLNSVLTALWYIFMTGLHSPGDPRVGMLHAHHQEWQRQDWGPAFTEKCADSSLVHLRDRSTGLQEIRW